jgi:hypothetical protein
MQTMHPVVFVRISFHVDKWGDFVMFVTNLDEMMNFFEVQIPPNSPLEGHGG